MPSRPSVYSQWGPHRALRTVAIELTYTEKQPSFSSLHLQVIKEGVKGADLNEVAKLFNIHDEPSSAE